MGLKAPKLRVKPTGIARQTCPHRLSHLNLEGSKWFIALKTLGKMRYKTEYQKS
jgi:hypothetical protein